MKYKDYNVQLTSKKLNIDNGVFINGYDKTSFIKMVVELKSKNDCIFYLAENLNIISLEKMDNKDFLKILISQLKLIVDKRIIENTIFNYNKKTGTRF